MKVLSIIIFVLSGYLAAAQQGKLRFTFDDFFKIGTFDESRMRGMRFSADGQHIIASEGRGTRLVLKGLVSGNTEKVLFDAKKSAPQMPPFSEFVLSADESKILMLTERESIYRRSFKAEYYVYSIQDDKLTRLSTQGKQQLASFSPDGNKVAFVRDNNLFIKDLVKGAEIQVTKDGRHNEVINGAPDWVYEEEFEFNKAFEWTADGKYLAWIRFDESKVPLFSMSLFKGLEPSLDEYSLYPGVESFKYPKAGEPNSVVSIHYYSIEKRKSKQLDAGDLTDMYIPRIRATREGSQLAFFRLNRHQDHLEIRVANLATGTSAELYSETNKCYIDEGFFDKFQFLDDRQHLLFVSERSGISQIYLMDLASGVYKRIPTPERDVLDVNACDVPNHRIYYTLAGNMPYQREVHCANWDGTQDVLLSTQPGYNKAAIAPTSFYMTMNHSDVSHPTTIDLLNNQGQLVRNLLNNQSLLDTLKYYRFNFKKFFHFHTADQVDLYGSILLPPDFDSTRKYPVLMTQYSGPNSQSVQDMWDMGWEDYLASQGYIVACVDGRGTGARGEGFRKLTYLQLGKYETIDQIETARYLGTLPFVDAQRIGIWGWSFGGYISASCMVKGQGVFKAGIAVAPVTNWRYYDNIYTERFMRTPAENASGYDENSPIDFADGLQGKLLICHGTGDDNVHVQNTLEFVESLVQANKQFEMQLYTNRNHGIYGGNTTYHLYTRMTDFLLKNL